MTPTMEHATERPRQVIAQSVTAVTRAELYRHLRRGGMWGTLLTASILGTAIGALMLILDATMTEGSGDYFNVLAVELGAGISAFITALATVFKVGRDNRGQLSLALGLVPRRGRLYIARAAGYATVAATTASAVALTLCGLSLLTHGPGPTGWALLAVPLAFCGAALLATISFGTTTLVRRSSAGILLFIGVLVVLPMAFLVAGMYLPEQLRPATELLAMNTPLIHVLEALSASHLPNPDQSGWAILQGMLGTAAWGLGLTLVAWPVFKNHNA